MLLYVRREDNFFKIVYFLGIRCTSVRSSRGLVDMGTGLVTRVRVQVSQ